METLKVPDLEKCYEILKTEGVPSHIIRHSEKVALISGVLGSALIEKGEDLDLQLLVAGGLLHDVKKFATLKTGENHAKAGERFIKELGYKEVARIVGAHVFFKPRKPYNKVWPEEIVFYADKRVKHEEIVSLDERFEDLILRYGKTEKRVARINFLYRFSKRIEKKIFGKLSFSPASLQKLNQIKEAKDALKKCLESGSSCWRHLI